MNRAGWMAAGGVLAVLLAAPVRAAELVYTTSGWTPSAPAQLEKTGNVVVISGATFTDMGQREWNQLILRGNATYQNGTQRLRHVGAGDAVITALNVDAGFPGVSILANLAVPTGNTLYLSGHVRLSGVSINPNNDANGTVQYEGDGELTLQADTQLTNGVFRLVPLPARSLVLNLQALTGSLLLDIQDSVVVTGNIPSTLRINATNGTTGPKTVDLQDGGQMAGSLDLQSTQGGGWVVRSTEGCYAGITVTSTGKLVTRGANTADVIQCLANVSGELEANTNAALSGPDLSGVIENGGTMRAVQPGTLRWTGTLRTLPGSALSGSVLWIGDATLQVNGGSLPNLVALGGGSLVLEDVPNPLNLSGDIASVSASTLPASVTLTLDRLNGGTTFLSTGLFDEGDTVDNQGVLEVAAGTTLTSSKRLINGKTLNTVPSTTMSLAPAVLDLDVTQVSGGQAAITVPTHVGGAWQNGGTLTLSAPLSVVTDGSFEHDLPFMGSVLLEGGQVAFSTGNTGAFTVLGTGSALQGAEIPEGVFVVVRAVAGADALFTVNAASLRVAGSLTLETQAAARTARVACAELGGEALVVGSLVLSGPNVGARVLDCSATRVDNGNGELLINRSLSTTGTFTNLGTVVLQGGTLAAADVVNDGTFGGYGLVDGPLTNNNRLNVAGGNLEVNGVFTQGSGGLLGLRVFQGFSPETNHVVVRSPHAVSLAGTVDLGNQAAGIVYNGLYALVVLSRPLNAPLTAQEVTLDPATEVVKTPPVTRSGMVPTDYGTWVLARTTDINVTFRPAQVQAHYSVETATGVARDDGSLLEWRQSFTASATWVDALSACLSIGGGWRVPTFRELVTLVNYGTAASPKVVQGVLPMPAGAVQTFWSATPKPGGGGVLVVDFATGQGVVAAVDGLHAVRCVRSPRR